MWSGLVRGHSKCLSRKRWEPGLEWVEKEVTELPFAPWPTPHPFPLQCPRGWTVRMASISSLVLWLLVGLGPWQDMREWGQGGICSASSLPSVTLGWLHTPVRWSELQRALANFPSTLMLWLSPVLWVPRSTPCPSPVGHGNGNNNPLPTGYYTFPTLCSFPTLCLCE